MIGAAVLAFDGIGEPALGPPRAAGR
jgi:hypothetical protein